jgi:uncharacterized protein (DUF952 family)
MMIYHITTLDEWETAKNQGHYNSKTIDEEGFIHCSFKSQLIRVANTFFSTQDNLLILEIDEKKLDSILKVESAIDVNDNYPHIYGKINLDAIVNTLPLARIGREDFILPEEIS